MLACSAAIASGDTALAKVAHRAVGEVLALEGAGAAVVDLGERRRGR